MTSVRNLSSCPYWRDPARVILQTGQFDWTVFVLLNGSMVQLPVTVTVELYQQGPDLLRVRLESTLPELPYLHTMSGGSGTFLPECWAAAKVAVETDTRERQ